MVFEDVSASQVSVPKDQFYTVQHFDYKCTRSRDGNGEPYGPTLSVVLNASVKMTAASAGKVLYERLQQNSQFPFTFIFNATFDSDKRLEDYDDGMVIYGYVVDIDESHNYMMKPDDGSRQVMIGFRVLVSSITFLGKDSNKSLYIIHTDE